MRGIEGECEQAECSSVQSCVVCKSRILVLSTHATSSLRVPALSLLTAASSNVKYIVSLWTADCESSIACSTSAQAYLLPLALGVVCRLSSRLSSKAFHSVHSSEAHASTLYSTEQLHAATSNVGTRVNTSCT